MVNPWGSRRVFLTGHTGFKGAWMALWMARRGARVRGYALDPASEPNLFHAASIAGFVEDLRGDVCDYQRLERALTEFAPEIVFHLAAQPLVRRSYAEPLCTYATNVMGTANLLEAVRHCPSVRAVVCVTTDKCYQNQGWIWPYRETDPLGGYDPYASSKACAELVVAAFRDSFFPANRLPEHRVGLATARAGNVIGGGDWSEDRLIPDLIRGFAAEQPVRIRQPKAIRPWQHVLDALYGYLQLAEELIAERSQFASSFNFGPSDEDTWPVQRVADYLAKRWGNDARWICDQNQGPYEHALLRLDSSKARVELGWRPRLNLETALEWTIDWYQAWRKDGSMQSETEAQIAAYEKLL